MTPTIRTLALLTGCYLSTGCFEPAAPSNQDKLPAFKAAFVKPPEKAPTLAAAPELTSLAPKTPGSLVDRPPVEKPSEQKTPDEAPKVESQAPKLALEALGPFEHVDFDRTLSPEEVHVDRFVLAEGVEQREPVGEGDTFSTDTKQIFAFVQLENGQGAPYAFQVHFEPVDGPATPYGVKLEVPTAVRFRTWSWTRIKRSPGRYKAVLRTLDGQDIASREFTIEAGAEQ